jgi:hypothetical protein
MPRTISSKTTGTIVNIPTADGSTWKDPRENPEAANAEIAGILSDVSTGDKPDLDVPADDLVELPGGLLKDDKLIRTAIVRELTGEDEEALARASQSLNAFHFIDRLLQCGVVRIGDLPPGRTEELLKELLVGDREALILGIRRSTYGNTIEIKDWKCPSCGGTTELSLEIEHIPSKILDSPRTELVFLVALRNGRQAHVRLANGSDQTALFEDASLTQTERETILLSRCIVSITDANGNTVPMAGFPSMARTLSIPDRHKVLKELSSRQPGPKYDDIVIKHQTCGNEVPVTLGIGDLFLDFGWF